uniref:Secreted protein n=1 Tax=Arundo donax TaxID=35708 RepID=A0A0A9DN84_ARUDO
MPTAAHTPFFLFLCLSAPWPSNSSIESHHLRQHQLHGSRSQRHGCASSIIIIRPSPPPDRPQLHLRCQCHTRFIRPAANYSWRRAPARVAGHRARHRQVPQADLRRRIHQVPKRPLWHVLRLLCARRLRHLRACSSQRLHGFL